MLAAVQSLRLHRRKQVWPQGSRLGRLNANLVEFPCSNASSQHQTKRCERSEVGHVAGGQSRPATQGHRRDHAVLQTP